ncbi:MAG: hypothetical protein H6R23_1507 [Proteobacteria bacterium]|nr:hypothetical protein [Pseudomonadota bacterium]
MRTLLLLLVVKYSKEFDPDFLLKMATTRSDPD